MKTIIEAKPRPNPAEIHKALQRGYGIKHPEKISGYAGFFMDYGEVKASDEVARGMENSTDFRDFILASVRSFQNDDYGLISDFDWADNIENKYLCGGGGEMFGRYAYGSTNGMGHGPLPQRIIKIRCYKGNTYVLYDWEYDWVIREKK